jgi:VanZ family protein
MTEQREHLVVFSHYYLPVILWMGLIFYLSSVPGLSSGVSSISVEIFLRKSAHTFEYFILTFLFWRIFYSHLKFSLLKSSILSFCCCLLFAIGDEIHQFFVQDRAGRSLDVLIDLIGGTFGILFGSLISKIKRNK